MENCIFQIKYQNGIDFDLKSNEVHAIVGDNDTDIKIFIQAIMGEEKNVNGCVIVKGENFKIPQIRELFNVSFLLPESTLIENLSVAENIALKKFPRKKNSPFIAWRKINIDAKELLKKLNIEVNYKLKVSEISSEEKKLVNIAKTFSDNSQLVIMYNPTEDLSPESVQKLYKIIHRYKSDGNSVIYITKLWEETLKVADRISVISEGKIEKTFMIEDAIKNPKELLNVLGRCSYKTTAENTNNESKEVLEAVFNANKFLTSEYELNDVLLLLAKEVTKFMNADGCNIYLIDEGTNTIIDKLEYKIEEDLQAVLKEEFILHVVNKQRLYYSNKHEKDFLAHFEFHNKVKTLICVPILIRSRVTGIIQIYYEELYTQSEEETTYLSAFARHAALAIEDTRLIGNSALLQESHHRIKNNLQSIVNIISLEKDEGDHNKLNDVLDNIISRVKSIQVIYDLLAKDKYGRSIINIKEIVEKIAAFYCVMDVRVSINLQLDDIFISYTKATSIALIINELISNCIKHAFTGKVTGSNIINVTCKKFNEFLMLLVEDNGRGIPKDFNMKNKDNCGVSIVTSIIEYEFKGNIEFISKKKGLRVIIQLPNKKVFVNTKI